MQLNDIKPKNKNRAKRRIGRGGKKGTYSGKGIKGQKSRAGRKMQPSMREVIKRYHKLRGYRQEIKEKFAAIVTTGQLEKAFKAGDKITPEVLLEKKIIAKIKGRTPQVKIVVKGELKKKLEVSNCFASSTAKAMVEKAGGSIK